MKISYFDFRARLIRGGHECTRFKLQGLYELYMRDCEPVWVSECINPKPIKPFLAVALPTVAEPAGAEPVVECVRINPRIVCENRILAALVERDMCASELAKLVDRCVTYVRVLIRRMAEDGRLEMTIRIIRIKTENGDQNARRNYYGLKKERAA